MIFIPEVICYVIFVYVKIKKVCQDQGIVLDETREDEWMS